MIPNMLGAYGPWAASLAGDRPARLSFRNARFDDLEAWRGEALGLFRERLLQPGISGVAVVTVTNRSEHDGLLVERLRWQLPFGPPTVAVFLRPARAVRPLPGVLALHDHAANKYFGAAKIARDGDAVHPMMKKHQDAYYGGTAWANELAKRGYAVLVPDTFAFGSRRVRLGDLPDVVTRGVPEPDPDNEDQIEAYNRIATEHEHIIAKSLLSAGTTWPGVFTAEDQYALDYLASRPDVDPERLGCGGLSGGGLRTVYLSALDPRIRCACCVGMMTTWRDFLLNVSYTHTWMIYVPGLSLELDYPEIFGLRPPRPVLVQSNEDDELFTLEEMRRADAILAEVYRKAKASDRYHASFHAGGHKFDRPMQDEAFAWFDRWLKE